MIRSGAHLPGREHAEQAHRAVADDHHGRSRLHIGGIGGEPACAENIGGRQQARYKVVGTARLRRRHERPVGERHPQERRLRPRHEFALDARGLIAVPAVRAGVVGSRERADHELARLHGFDRAADFFDEAAVFVPHGRRAVRSACMPRYGHRSDPQTHVAAMRITASVGLLIFGSSRSSNRMSPGPYKTVPRIVLLYRLLNFSICSG